jgi:hypothetical protein
MRAIALIIGAVRTSETSVYLNDTHGAISQSAVIFIYVSSFSEAASPADDMKRRKKYGRVDTNCALAKMRAVKGR